MDTLSAVHSPDDGSDKSHHGRERTPVTPRQATTFLLDPSLDALDEESTPNTPTRFSFGGVPGQRPLPDDIPSAPEEQVIPNAGQESLKRDASQQSTSEHSNTVGDVEMGGDEDGHENEDGSDNDSVTSDSQRPSKKKKGQRFFCTDYPPCTLSFTRSEHLARHIRKHTGERPFQCHCSRRFSRLDNLRQHAQTVHVNEEIPGDSLAATSTRFQRQIRTDRVRPAGNRSRASTIGSNGGPGRGHSRNLSSSSIGSASSSVGIPEEPRRRPPPLAMANDPAARARLSLDTMNPMTGSPIQQLVYFNQSPTGYSTPTSTNFSTGASSPRFTSGMASPASTLSRSSFYNGARMGRRLSVPSSANPIQNPNGNNFPPTYFTPLTSGTSSTFSQNSSVFGSPTSSVFAPNRYDHETDLEYRRRTWHSGTHSSYAQRPATSGLSYQQTPDDQRPEPSDQPAASQMTRLPGIESFDHAVRSQQSPMVVDSSPRPSSSHRVSDSGLHQNLTKLDITAANAPVEGQMQVTQPQPIPQRGYFGQQPGTTAPQQMHQHSTSMPEPVTPRRNKRQAWYGGPVAATSGHAAFATMRPSPEDSGSSDGVPTPSQSQGSDYHPVIINSNGTVEPYPPNGILTDEQKPYMSIAHGPLTPTYALQAGLDPRFTSGYSQQPSSNGMGRLEALVAVATSENRAVEERT